MPRPTLTHDGFLIPNASRVSHPRMAEPDQIDFNTLGHSLWGVIEDCLVTVSGSTASTLGGLAFVNGTLVSVSGQSVNLGIGGVLDRFDLIVVNEGGTLLQVRGTENTDPVFPDVPLDCLLLAAVFIPTGTSSLGDNVVDKRRFLRKSWHTRVPTTATVLRNLGGDGLNEFLVRGDGLMAWRNGSSLRQDGDSPPRMRLTGALRVDAAVTVGASLSVTTSAYITGKVTAQNILAATSPPSTAGRAPATIWQDETNGRLYILRGGSWQELATVEGAVPVGTIIESVQPKAFMAPLGWVALDGSTISEVNHPSLFSIPNLGTISGTAPNRTMVLPNAERRTLLTVWGSAPLRTGGRTGNSISLALANMPPHKHDVAVQNGGSNSPLTVTLQPAGSHGHTIPAGGQHGHTAVSVPHVHRGMNWFGNASPIIAVAWGGRNKLDALFNDRNHTYSVEPMEETMPATTEVHVHSTMSAHSHVVESNGQHTHPATITGSLVHDHAVTESSRGSGDAIDITNQFLSVYTYIRA